MIRIAIQSKGRLHDDTMALLAEADIKLSVSKRTLISDSTTFPLQALYLRDDDIPETVSNGVADLGVVGENEFLERGYDAEVVSVNVVCLLPCQRRLLITVCHGLTDVR